MTGESMSKYLQRDNLAYTIFTLYTILVFILISMMLQSWIVTFYVRVLLLFILIRTYKYIYIYIGMKVAFLDGFDLVLFSTSERFP